MGSLRAISPLSTLKPALVFQTPLSDNRRLPPPPGASPPQKPNPNILFRSKEIVRYGDAPICHTPTLTSIRIPLRCLIRIPKLLLVI